MTLSLTRFLGLAGPAELSLFLWTLGVAWATWEIRDYLDRARVARWQAKLWSGERMR